MPDYREINNHLMIALNDIMDIMDIAEKAILETGENIISDNANLPKLHIIKEKEE